MKKSFSFIDHTADIAVELTAGSIPQLFEAGAEAWLAAMADEIKLEPDDLLSIGLSASSVEELLVSFLNELNYLLITKKWLCLSVYSIKIFDNKDCWELSAEVRGTIFKEEIKLKNEIKSVTYHQVEIVEKDGEYSTLIVFDI